MKKTILLSLLLPLFAMNAAAERTGALALLTGHGTISGDIAVPEAPAPEKVAGRKSYVSDLVYAYKPDAQAKAAEYSASITAAGIEVLGTTILTREDGDATLHYFSIQYAGNLNLKSEQQAGIPEKLRADIMHDDFRNGLRRAGLTIVRSGVRKEEGAFTAYCLYAQEESDLRAVRTYASLPRQSGAGLDATTLFHENMGPAIAELEDANSPVVFRLRAPTGWMIKFFSANKPKRLQSGVQASYVAALTDMRATVARLKQEGKIILDANTALVGSYWTVDFVEK